MFFALDFQWISVSSAGKLIVRGVVQYSLAKLRASSLKRRSSGRTRRLSTNMELGSELEAHNPLESFHQLRSQPHATPAVRNISSQGIVETQLCILETLHAAGTDVSSAGTFFSSTAAASLLGCLSERGAFRRHDEFWLCGHGLHAWAALQELRRDESPCCA